MIYFVVRKLSWVRSWKNKIWWQQQGNQIKKWVSTWKMEMHICIWYSKDINILIGVSCCICCINEEYPSLSPSVFGGSKIKCVRIKRVNCYWFCHRLSALLQYAFSPLLFPVFAASSSRSSSTHHQRHQWCYSCRPMTKYFKVRTFLLPPPIYHDFPMN